MQALCEREVQQEQTDADMLALFRALNASSDAEPYAMTMVQSTLAQQEHIDRYLTAASKQWGLSRISPVERNIMRVAVNELLGGGVPAKVAINEAIEIGKEFGGLETPRFINGVLDEIWRHIKEETGRET